MAWPRALSGRLLCVTDEGMSSFCAASTRFASAWPDRPKVTSKDVKTRNAREGTNPLAAEPTTFKAKAASKTAKVAALNKLKDAVGAKSRSPGDCGYPSHVVPCKAASPASVRRYA
jgi:hypothetical protein